MRPRTYSIEAGFPALEDARKPLIEASLHQPVEPQRFFEYEPLVFDLYQALIHRRDASVHRS